MPVDPHTLPCVVARGSGWGSLQKHTLTSLPCMPRLWQGTCLPQRTRFIHSEVRAWISRKGSRTNFRWISSDADTLRDVWRAAPLFVTAQYNFSLRVLQNDPSLVLRHRRTWLLLIALERLPRERHALTAGMRAAAALEHHTRAPQPVPSRRLGPAT